MRHLVAISITLGLAARPVHAQGALGDAIKHNAYPLAVKAGKLDGAGAKVLRPVITAAQFVMLGEDHGIAEIPVLAAALCTELAPAGFHRLALEVGPSVARELEAFAKAPDSGPAIEFAKKYPETIAFYGWREELGFLQTCGKAMGATPLQIWGLDQELMGAPVYVLPKILDTKPGPKAKAAIEALVQENDADHLEAAKTGDYSALFMMKVKQATLDAAKAALAKDGSVDAQKMFAALLESRAIYQGQFSGPPYISNRRRARLMKETFLDDLSAAASADKAFPKVLLKFGAEHMYRGLNPLRSSELGNLVGEAAEGHKVESVNLLVLGVKGQQLRVAGVSRPEQPAALDLKTSEFAFLAPFFDAQLPGSWTLFDLRPLRPGFAKLGKLDPELERAIFGFDFLVLIAEPKPEHALP